MVENSEDAKRIIDVGNFFNDTSMVYINHPSLLNEMNGLAKIVIINLKIINNFELHKININDTKLKFIMFYQINDESLITQWYQNCPQVKSFLQNYLIVTMNTEDNSSRALIRALNLKKNFKKEVPSDSTLKELFNLGINYFGMCIKEEYRIDAIAGIVKKYNKLKKKILIVCRRDKNELVKELKNKEISVEQLDIIDDTEQNLEISPNYDVVIDLDFKKDQFLNLRDFLRVDATSQVTLITLFSSQKLKDVEEMRKYAKFKMEIRNLMSEEFLSAQKDWLIKCKDYNNDFIPHKTSFSLLTGDPGYNTCLLVSKSSKQHEERYNIAKFILRQGIITFSDVDFKVHRVYEDFDLLFDIPIDKFEELKANAEKENIGIQKLTKLPIVYINPHAEIVKNLNKFY